MEEIIRTENISKQYRDVKAVDDVSLNVKKGEIYGFLGLNGAGKTTTIRMLLGMIKPTAGSAYIKGSRVNAGNYRIWKDIGYMVEMPYSYPDLTVRENLDMSRRLRGLKGTGILDQIIGRLKLDSYADIKAKNLSMGNAQRVGIAKALMHEPEILLLDEPANGLDPAGIVEIREMLKDLASNKGVTIFISSHILNEVAKLATKIGIIHCGRLIQESDYDSLEKSRIKKLVIGTRDNNKASEVLSKAGYKVVPAGEGVIEIRDEKAISAPEVIDELLVNKGLPPYILKAEEEELEEYFLRIIGFDGGGK